MKLATHDGGIRALWSAALADGHIGLAWLSQASFALRAGGLRLLIDPFLSDSLAARAAGRPTPAGRLMPAPIEPAFFVDLDWVLCTHEHLDHMDPETLPALADASPRCRFVVPAAEREAALGKCRLPADRLVTANAGDAIDLGNGVRVTVTPAAHESLKTNARGEHHFLGFVVRTPAGTVWHSGDTIVFDGLADAVRGVDLALLPINGRDAARTARGIVGNMNFDEARALCVAAGIPRMVPHHFGLFASNTVPVYELERAIAASHDVACTLPRIDAWYEGSVEH